MLEHIIDYDTNLFLFLNSKHTEFWDSIMWIVSGKLTWIPLYLLVAFFVVRKYRWKGVLTLLLFGVLITLADQISVRGFKEVFERLRPSHNPHIAHLVHSVNDYKGGQYGFVSSHAANCFAFAVFSLKLFRRSWYSAAIIFWASFVAYSRVYMGVHYPGDILGGAILGSVIGIVVYQIHEYIFFALAEKARRRRNEKRGKKSKLL